MKDPASLAIIIQIGSACLALWAPSASANPILRESLNFEKNPIGLSSGLLLEAKALRIAFRDGPKWINAPITSRTCCNFNCILNNCGRPQRAMQGRHSASGKGRFDNLVGVIVGKCDRDNDLLKQKAAQLSGNESR